MYESPLHHDSMLSILDIHQHLNAIFLTFPVHPLGGQRYCVIHQDHLNTCLLWRNVQIPINLTSLSVPTHQPLIRLLEVLTLEPPAARTQWTGMHALQHQMLLSINLNHSFPSRAAPREKDHAFCSLFRHNLNDPLSEGFPAPIAV